MIKALIIIAIIAAVLLGGWQLFDYWQKIENEKDTARNQAASKVVRPDLLPGMDPALQPSLDDAEKQGPGALRAWLEQYGASVQDPKLAWIQLDYCVMLARENPRQAKEIFDAVKKRTPPNSPVWPRIQELQGAYQ